MDDDVSSSLISERWLPKASEKRQKTEEKDGYPIERCKGKKHQCDELGSQVVERKRKNNLDFLFVAIRRPEPDEAASN